MRNRGPDGKGEWYSSTHRMGLAHRRLSIIDLDERATQPMVSEDGRYVISFNGEIYNFKQLAEDNSITLTTDSDCEIILHLYQKYGIEFTLSILDGVFAFVLYDKNINKVIIARDPYGVRPLYYFNENNIIPKL